MRLDLRKIKDFPGKREDFSYKLHGLSLGGIEQPPFDVSGCVKNSAGVLLLEGRAESVLSLVCDRCGAPFRRGKSLDVSGVLSDSAGDVFSCNGGSVDLDGIFTSELILDMDMKILCGEDCAGGSLEKYIYIEKEQ